MGMREIPEYEIRKLCFNLLELKEPKRTEMFSEMKKSLKRFVTSADNLERLCKLVDQTTVNMERSLLSMAVFLWAFEGFYVSRLDFICLLLSAKGHPFPNTRKQVPSIKEIKKIHTEKKFRFLKSQKFNALLRNQDRKVRNKIAHHDFILEENGNVFLDDKAVDIHSKLSNLFQAIRALDSVLLECIHFALLKAHLLGLLEALDEIAPSNRQA